MRHITAICCLAAVACVPAAAAWAQEGRALQQALNKSVSLTAPDSPIGDVFEKLSKASGAKFVLDDDTLAYLPYGDQTHVSVTVPNVTLRDALGKLLAPLSLRWMPDGEVVRIVPSESLARMARRASYDEFQTLSRLNTSRLSPPGAAGPVIDQLRSLTKNKNLKLVSPNVPDEVFAQAMVQAQGALPATPVDWLDALTAGNDWSWRLWGDDIVVLPKVRQVEHQLQRQVSLRYQNQRLVDVLRDLAHKARIKLELAPDVLNCVPVEMRNNFNLMMADSPISEALTVIGATTGLVFERTSEGVRVDVSPALRARVESGSATPTVSVTGTGVVVANVTTGGAPTGSATQPYKRPFFIRLNVPVNGVNVEAYVRSDELPEDVVNMIDTQKNKLINQLRSGEGNKENK